MKYKTLNMLAALALGIFLVGCGPSKNKEENTDSNEVAEEQNEDKFETKASERDAEFVANAVAGNYAEIKMAEIAKTRSSNTEVQAIAAMLVDDHTAVLNQLKDFASKRGISIPVEEKDDAKDKIADLEKQDAKDFDKKWCNTLVDKHEKTIKDFESNWEKTDDSTLKEWINQTLPHLKTHLDKLTTCDKNLKS
ncbi:DUF4142 domain-containing protein [Chryseolinea lacunae]|uniref:DUF4142 domain-containing protein n=1 Tax=Chryseolinea lacunae TaxID=2801331 RepID=A0ABS1KY31_9BACT|nr:DUF4142 domain-containing protein [Chryseolinea lacunae]MBL0744359.1 DUF4142 domain-containing protein [Chryseolinea lacunae]